MMLSVITLYAMKFTPIVAGMVFSVAMPLAVVDSFKQEARKMNIEKVMSFQSFMEKKA